MSFPRYPEYKVSNTDFIGQVPAHWKLKRLKHCAEVFPSNVDKKSVDGQVPVKLCNYTDVYYNDTIGCALGFMLATATKEQAMRFELQQGDVVFTKDSESADDIGVAAYISKRLPGVVYGYHLSIARANRAAIGEFLKQYFNSQETKSYFAVSANGLTRVGLGQYAVDNAPIALPTVEEQTQIAHFLDHETAKIDTLIHEQKRLIELLKEKRQAVISHAVTKGFDLNVPMKDSGVEWLGEVPAHWKVVSLKMLVDVRDGTHETPEYVDPSKFTYPLVTSRDVTGGQLLVDECNHISSADYHSIIRRSGVSKGDILMPMIGTVGSPLLIIEDFEIAIKNLALFKTSNISEVLTALFLFHFLTSNECKVQFDLEARGGVQSFVSLGTLRNLRLAIPPIDEQRSIIIRLDQDVLKIDNLVIDSGAGINLLKERRAALISAAVTGKIDVRNWQPPADESAFDEEMRQAEMKVTA
jgi:type I restriction enzyme S subunit